MRPSNLQEITMTRTLIVVVATLMAAVATVQCVLVPYTSVARPDVHHRRTPDQPLRLIDDYRRASDPQPEQPYLSRQGHWPGGTLHILFRRVDDEYSADPNSDSTNSYQARIGGHKRKREANFDSFYPPRDI
ncbi:uncharacterized protein LOC134796828 isoform X1 [Cydia splendana]|uniref:uncharacterized protein LOC134796828 isoform X1 n=1 Tax=Cydia splendana TaxID=1100963 RepID=UPI00300D88C2